jgi:hypothetical protein
VRGHTKRQLTAALGCVVVGSIVWAPPGSADGSNDIPTDMRAVVSPNPVAGGDVVITPIDPCPAGSTGVHWTDGSHIHTGEVGIEDTQGSWHITLPAPSTPGEHRLFVACETLSPDGLDDTALYQTLTFHVEAAPPAPQLSSAAPVDVPADPRSRNPHHTG